MIYLVDMDSTITNVVGRFVGLWAEKHPDKIQLPAEEITTFYLEESFPKEYKPLIREIWASEGFFINQKPISGSLEALEKLASNNEVFICSSPLSSSKTCLQEKNEWVREYLGKDWTKRLILGKDKTLVYGDRLIDDKSSITGIKNPSWEHIIYTQSWNLDVKDKRRLNWENYKEVLNIK